MQIDDAGSGSLIGGTCIGAMRMETHEFVYDFIPLKFYREGYFENKAYLDNCHDIVFRLLSALNVDNKEKIQICQGYMFANTRKSLVKKGYRLESTKITNPLQQKIENTFQNYTLKLGLPIQYVKYTQYPLHFHRILRWVYADYDNRHLLCKTGWKSWQKYGHLKIEIEDDILYQNNYKCLKCGKKIHRGSTVKVLKYTSNCPNTIYLHHKC